MSRKERDDAAVDAATAMARIEMSEVYTEEHARKQLAKLDDAYRKQGLEPLPKEHAPDTPDAPPCDYCGEEFKGSLVCAKCQSMFYCSRECQVASWKKAGHKQTCAQMKADCESAGREVVQMMSQGSCLDRVGEMEWKRLDGAGAYKFAIAHGLHEALYELIEDELRDLRQRWFYRRHVCYVEWIMCTLFRNGRQEGKTAPHRGAFSGIDAYRVKQFLFSKDNVLEKWFEASMTMQYTFLSPAIQRDERSRLAAHRSARNVVASWILVFANPKASKAVLLGPSKRADDVAVKRAKFMAEKLRVLLPKLWCMSDNQSSSLDGQWNQLAGMLQYRCEEFGVNIGDMVKLLKLKKERKSMYLQVAVPFAEGTIRKGRMLTTPESQVIMARGHA